MNKKSLILKKIDKKVIFKKQENKNFNDCFLNINHF